MKLFFSGFCLENESELFNDYIIKNDFTVNGFSYGCIKAVEYVLKSTQRIDKIQLFSPSFFNDKDKKYKRLQLMFFNKDNNTYCKNFLKNCGFSKELSNKYFKLGTLNELEELLYYQWDNDKLQQIKNKNIEIEVYLGSGDKIIDSYKAMEFFKEYADVYLIKNKGHIL
ncbi:MAG: pimelyl-ACP methyl ester esterase BioV [Campylobacterota bacterium]|nr:pimelyl-ACP methyl ester esterase BioV [Campylobacterota bacterium]